MTLNHELNLNPKSIAKDFLSGLIVFLIALPLCLGIAIASDADPIAGLIAGIVGGILVGFCSGSHTSVSGPAAGLTAIVAAQIAGLGSYETFLLAVVLGGVIQIGLGVIKAGALSAFFPSSVINGLLAAIGLILIFKQVPLLLGHTKDMGPPFGHAESIEDYEAHKASGEIVADHTSHDFGDVIVTFLNSLKEILAHEGGWQVGAITIGILSLAFLIAWDQIGWLKKSLVPSPLLVVIIGGLLAWVFSKLTGDMTLTHQQFVDVPHTKSLSQLVGLIRMPDFTQLSNSAVYVGAITIAVVASLESLLNLDAVDKLDRRQRLSPPNRELVAQGIGNVASGMLGGIPVTSVVIRGSVNVSAGSETKLSTIFHGLLLLGCVALIPNILRMIPLSCLAAILLMTGYKLASPALFRRMWQAGPYQFWPFFLTVVAIVLTDLLIGIGIGLVLSILFILNSNLRRPIRVIRENHVDGQLLHIELANQVSFLNRAALDQVLRGAPKGSRVMLDARQTDYIDPDILSLIRDFRDSIAPAHNILVQMVGFQDRYKFKEKSDMVDLSLHEAREKLTPDLVIDILAEGNKRFVEGHPLDRTLFPTAQANGQPMKAFALVLTGIDSRTPAEMIFDLGPGEAFVSRVPGIVVDSTVLGGVEFAAMAGQIKLVVVLGDIESSLVATAIQQSRSLDRRTEYADCEHLVGVLDQIAASINQTQANTLPSLATHEQREMTEHLVVKHVLRMVARLTQESSTLQRLSQSGQIKIVGGLYNSQTGEVEFLQENHG